MPKHRHKTIRGYTRDIERAQAKIRDILEARLKRAMERAIVRTRGKFEIRACSAMGSWSMDVYDKKQAEYDDLTHKYTGKLLDGPSERKPQVFELFQRVFDEHGWAGIPAPVLFVYKPGGKLETLRDW